MNALSWAAFAAIDWSEIGFASLDTLTMLGMALLFTVLAGLPVGVLLYLTAPGALLARPRLYAALSLAINLLRSLPFIILLIVMIPSRCSWWAPRWAWPGPSRRWWLPQRPSSPAWPRTPCARWTPAWWRPARPWARACINWCSRCCCPKPCPA
jgi:hypothetical protein